MDIRISKDSIKILEQLTIQIQNISQKPYKITNGDSGDIDV